MNDLARFLMEDVGRGDITTELTVPDVSGKASVICEEDAVVAGIEEASEIFSMVGADVSVFVKDGSRIKAGTRIMSVSGPARGLMTAERTALNILMRMSGIATAVSKANEILKSEGSEAKVCGTRKTTPGFRKYEKKAVALGGGQCHRFGLDDMILIKDNHIKTCGSVKGAMEKVSKAQFHIKTEIEVGSLEDAVTAAEMGADIIMADNMVPEDILALKNAVRKINPRILVEASGNITLENIAQYGCADLISMGSLTHSVKAVHFSMDMD